MKMRFVFILSLVAFFNPISVFATNDIYANAPAPLAKGENADAPATFKKCGHMVLKGLPGDETVAQANGVSTGRTKRSGSLSNQKESL